ncbi:pathogen-associated molecular patterns-induced protein A70-like [Salvia splendens]|uniref:pathogen-associated molecular patterns-induced protein A70-like n=1 Tax=Salvia splendens TaxID=180675 RepID=UPI001C2532A1|nr:pathogen-associated molecular patterns-induced protein A70-like [Salvia splendens]
MLEDSASAIQSSSLWASMNSWLTPTVLFLLLNLMIATIAFTSSTFSHPQNPPPSPARSPSLLHRLKSINLLSSPPPQDSSLHHKQIPDSDTHFAAHYFFPNPHESEETPTSAAAAAHESSPHLASAAATGRETEAHFDFEEKAPIFADFEAAREGESESLEMSMDEVYSQLNKDATHFNRTKSDTKPAGGEIPAKLAAKMRKSASVKSAFNHFEEGDIMEARRPATVREGRAAVADEGGVDAKADDFINRFKQQLKLQRLDSIIRYKDMIGRGR